LVTNKSLYRMLAYPIDVTHYNFLVNQTPPWDKSQGSKPKSAKAD